VLPVCPEGELRPTPKDGAWPFRAIKSPFHWIIDPTTIFGQNGGISPEICEEKMAENLVIN
jgi:hypothetical protein